MLYKKYHRNFVKQFRKGTKIYYKTYSGDEIKDTVRIEPYFSNDYHEIHISDNKYGWILVYRNGMIERSIKVV